MRNSTSRRGQTSITHLMNITLPPRPQAQFHTPRPAGRDPRYARSGIGSGYHASDKARCVHACGSPRLTNTTDILRADISMQTTDLSSIRQATTAHRRSMLTCLSIGTTCCRYSSLQNLSSLHVQYVYHILWHLEWQSAATYFVYHV
jgi:hypothetical protein